MVCQDLRDLEEDVVNKHIAHDLIFLILQWLVVFLETNKRFSLLCACSSRSLSCAVGRAEKGMGQGGAQVGWGGTAR